MEIAPFLLLPCLAAAMLFGWQLRRARAELAAQRALTEARSRQFSLLTRDLHSLGMALLGRAQTLSDGVGLEREARQLLALADAAAEETALDLGPRRLQESSFPLGPLLHEAVAIASAQLGHGRRHWRIAPELADLTATADRRALRGALVQVLGRAARATREGDWIDLRVELRDGAATIVIEDEGVGLAVDDLDPVAADGGPLRTRGLGFGLAVARALLQAHGGELLLEAAPGVGARAFLSLPRSKIRPAAG
jgi:signal transduction histidine kinase